MDEKQNSLPEPCLLEMEFRPCACPEGLSPAGVCFAPPPEHAEGYYWYYEQEGLFAISMFHLDLKHEIVMEYQQPEFISVNHYDSISAEEFCPYRHIASNTIRGHVSNQAFYRGQYHPDVPARGMEIMFMPGYYHDYLERRYPGEFPDPKAAFLSIDGSTDFPELILLLRQIEAFQGTGMAAHLFYESKAAEAVSLIIEKTKASHALSAQELTVQDSLHLSEVKDYIEQHYCGEIYTEDLRKIACMGQTKLRSSFKAQYGCTITEYIQNKRVAQAEYLLLKTDLPIREIAQEVGYHHAGRFASLFRKSIGLSPEEYRKLVRI